MGRGGRGGGERERGRGRGEGRRGWEERIGEEVTGGGELCPSVLCY